MKRTTTKLGELLKARRASLGLTQRSLAQKLGVEASHVAFIESGRRRPSLKLVARIADALGLDRQELLILAHPEARDLIRQTQSAASEKPPISFQRFAENTALLARYFVNERELQVLLQLSFLGSAISTREFLTILALIRDMP
jgi:transcriptional regulator with XRE-family HTH domain